MSSHYSLSRQTSTHTLLACIVTAILSTQLAACSKKEEASYSANEQAQSSPAVASSTAMTTTTAVTATATSSNDVASIPASAANGNNNALTLGNSITNQQQTNTVFANKKMVVTANANFQVKDVQQTANQIEAIARQHGGYVANSEIGNNDSRKHSYPIGNYQRKELTSYSRHATMLVRVPKAQVGEFLQQLQQLIAFLDNSQFNAKDVTLDIQKAQVEAQIQALKAAQLSEQKADKTTEAGNMDVANQTALSRQQQLYADLQRQQLEDEVNLSTIQLNFYQPEKIREQIVEDIDGKMQGEKSVNFLPRLTDNLKAGWLYLVEFVLFLSQFWSLLLGFGLLWWAWRWLLKRLPKQRPTLSKSIYRQTPSEPTNDSDRQNFTANHSPSVTPDSTKTAQQTPSDERKSPD